MHNAPCKTDSLRIFFFFSHSFPSTFLSNNNQTSTTPVQSISTPSVLASASASLPSVSNSIVTSGLSELKSSSGSRKARVLYDYDAANSSELSLLADEVRVFYLDHLKVKWNACE